MHHVGILCENLERSLDFYQNILGNHTSLSKWMTKITVEIHNFVVLKVHGLIRTRNK